MLQCDILLLGEYFFDQIFTGMPEFPELGREVYASDLTTTGGAMFITAAALTRLGAKVGWPACFGDDAYSQFVRDLAVREGIDLTLARSLPHPYRRVTTSIPLEGERAFVTYADPQVPDRDDHWLASMERCHFAHLHLGSLMPGAAMELLTTAARRKGTTVSSDCQDGPHLKDPQACREAVRLVDIFMPNAREAQIIAETTDMRHVLARLLELTPLVVIKDGANGAWVGRRGGEVLHAPAVCVGPAVDTTGAGDCFNAGFLYGYIVERAPLERCLLYGNICGGLSVTAVGGATAAPTRAELAIWLDRIAARQAQAAALPGQEG